MSNIAKLIIGILLVVLMIPMLGVVYVKDNLHSPSYCASCHEEYYRNWLEPDVEYSLSNHHYQVGVSCQTCHQRTLGESLTEVITYFSGNYDYPLRKSEVPMDKCFACHVDYETIIAPLDPAITLKERNPHAGHWGELECGTCHNAHQDSVVYCDECHGQYFEEMQPGYIESGSN
jgi:hypothetical protein